MENQKHNIPGHCKRNGSSMGAVMTFKLTGEGGKGSKRRPTATSKREAELRDAIWREKDKKKKAKIRKELEELK